MNAFGTEVSAGALTAGPSGEPGSGGVNDASWEDEIGNAEDDVEEALESLSATTYSADAASLVEETKVIFQKVEQAQKTAKMVRSRRREILLARRVRLYRRSEVRPMN